MLKNAPSETASSSKWFNLIWDLHHHLRRGGQQRHSCFFIHHGYREDPVSAQTNGWGWKTGPRQVGRDSRAGNSPNVLSARDWHVERKVFRIQICIPSAEEFSYFWTYFFLAHLSERRRTQTKACWLVQPCMVTSCQTAAKGNLQQSNCCCYNVPKSASEAPTFVSTLNHRYQCLKPSWSHSSTSLRPASALICPSFSFNWTWSHHHRLSFCLFLRLTSAEIIPGVQVQDVLGQARRLELIQVLTRAQWPKGPD